MKRTLAHVSDLHIGRDQRTDDNAAWIARALFDADVDAVLVTGDVTHRGRYAELNAFERFFEPLRDRMVVIPGNHDRLGEDAARFLMPGRRVAVAASPGLYIVRLDSTAPHNRDLLEAHGELTTADIASVDLALKDAPAGALIVVMLHHHVLPLPADHLGERLATWLGWPNAAELALGRSLLEVVKGKGDLVLHGHRHKQSAVGLPAPNGRTLHIRNAGSTPDLGKSRIFLHEAGQIVSEGWLDVSRPADARPSPVRPRRPAPLAA